MPYAEISYAFKIADHAHAVLGSISLIQMVQPAAGETVTRKAVLDFRVHYLLTVFDSTNDAGFRFEAVLTLATRAWFLIPCVC